MVINDLDREVIKSYLEELKSATELNDRDYWRATLRRIDNIPRDLKVQMITDLCEYWEGNDV